MKLRYFLLSAIALLTAGHFSADAAIKFARSSKLRTGNWVKVGVEESGIYEISYQTLREMGFSDPASVTLFGRGGKPQDLNFQSAGGIQTYKDDLEEVPVLHFNDKIYFYGQGVTNYAMTVSLQKYDAGGFFNRQSKNIYADRGYYFLSDTGSGLRMKNQTGSFNNLEEITSGIGFYAHEIDLVQNDSNTGQLFFGEKTDMENPRLEWDVYLPGAISGKDGAMECYYYIDRKREPLLTYGCADSGKYISGKIVTPSSTNFTPAEPHIGETRITGEDATVFLHCEPDSITSVSHLDYWTLTYQREMPDLEGKNGKRLSQDIVGFPRILRSTPYKARLKGGATNFVLDITKPTSPEVAQTMIDGMDAWLRVANVNGAPHYVVFDPSMPQKQISGYQNNYSKIANQDLHARLSDGADMLIICIPALRTSAQRIADLHEQYDGIKVVVATTDECYNEFSSGVPDPMAYRGAVKMAYDSPTPCKNLLLMGPLFADFRGIVTEKQPEEGIIAFQATPMNQIRGAQNANIYYGIMSDYITTNLLENAKVAVGVGILPVRYEGEANTVIEKIEKHLQQTDHAYFINYYSAIGGVGDDHTHDSQALRSTEYLTDLDHFSTISSNIIIDAYGYKEAQRKFFNDLNSGRYFVSYFGHGAEYTLNHEGDFFYASDVYKLRNKINPLMFFAGCELSNTDRGVRGMGEALVTSTPYGMLGTILATRETWSGQNEDLVKMFLRNMYRDGSTVIAPYHPKPLTIGEVWARTLTQSTYNNELAYQLICDPAIVIPVVTRPLLISNPTFIVPAKVGEFLEFKGRVAVSNNDTSTDKEYNGTAVVRLLEPKKVIPSADIITGDKSKVINVTYADTQISMTSAEVVNGEFSARIYIPLSAKEFIGDELGRLHIVTYSDESGVAAGNMYNIQFLTPSDESLNNADNQEPVIRNFSYDADKQALIVEVADNCALSFADSPLRPSFRMAIDGRDYAAASSSQPIVANDGAEYSRTVYLSDLTEGTHTAKINVSDASGNVATAEITFEYLPYRAKFTLRLENEAVNESGEFAIIGEIPASADIVIMDSKGYIVRRDKVSGARYDWNACDNTGAPVSKGLYKAYIIETGTGAMKGHSAPVNVPVI